MMKRPRFRGHRPVFHRPGDWRCSCGVPLSGGPFGSGQRGARDVMRFHRADLWMSKREAEEAPEYTADRTEKEDA